MDQVPPVAVVDVPTAATPSYNCTVASASAVPVKVRAEVFFVILSVLESPVSSAAAKSGTLGDTGTPTSFLNVAAPVNTVSFELFPAASDAVILMAMVPSVNAVAVVTSIPVASP